MFRICVLTVLLVLSTSPVQAHAIRASVSVSETQVSVTVSFDGEDDLRGEIFVWLEDEHRNQLQKIKLTGTNVATFPRPTNGVYYVVAEDDGFGHRVQKRFTVTSDKTDENTPQPQSDRTIGIISGLFGILFATVLAYLLLSRPGKAKHGS